MKQLEDRIKDRLEGYESSLPKGDLAEFKALLDASATAGKKQSPAYLAWLAPVAVAAGLALFFVFGHGPQQEMIQVVDGGSLVADVVEVMPAAVDEMAETEPVEQVTMVQTTPSGSKRKMQPSAAVAVNEEQKSVEITRRDSKQSTADPAGSSQQEGDAEQEDAQKRNSDGSSVGGSTGYSPFVPSVSNSRKPVSVKVGKATAGVIGGAGIAALAGMLPTLMMKSDFEHQGDGVYNPGGIITDPEPPLDKRTWNDTHHMPLRAGISFRVPFADRWSLTTGLDYSLYASELEYSLSGIHKQSVHCAGVPLRADFTIARNRWMDVYVGAGGSLDFCVAAYDAGQKVVRDGVEFSLIGAGGIQFNITKNLGLFFDPTLSWDMTPGNRVLDTYRSEHPVMFYVSTGVRFTVKH